MAIYALTANRSIKANLSAAAATVNPDFIATYADTDGASFVENTVDGVFTGNSDVTIVSAPAGSTRRIVRDINIVNRDSAAVTVNLKFDNAGTQRRIRTVTLGVNETWTMDGSYDVYGNYKQSATAGTTFSISGYTYAVIYQTATTMTISGLGFLGVITVRFQFTGASIADVTVNPTNSTTLSVNVPSSIYNLAGGTTGTITLIDAAGRQSNGISTSVQTLPTGGSITTNGSYKIHTFTSSSSFITGTYALMGNYEYIIVAGGGAAGTAHTGAGGGGGGGYLTGNVSLSPSTTYNIVIGAGGTAPNAGPDTTGGNGQNSTAFSLTAIGGGGGGAYNSASGAGNSGGSGGGGEQDGSKGGAGTPGQGFAGGGGAAAPQYGSGGGGGAGAVGSAGSSTAGGDGGIGRADTWTGATRYLAGGGGGNVYTSSGTEGAGGSGGGGAGGSTAAPQGNDGGANTGGGGGGNKGTSVSPALYRGGNGGSGIVIIRYLYA